MHKGGGGVKVGVALGGGGSRAFSHLGVLTELARAGVRVGAVSGSSLGAVLGALYALEPDAEGLKRRALEYFSGSKLFGLNPKPARNDGLGRRPGIWGRFKKTLRTLALCNLISLRRSICFSNPVERAVDDLVPEADFSAAALPFACNAINLTRGRLQTIVSGPLRPALKAGTTVGLVFPPYAWEGDDYVDAAPLSSVPVRACRALGAEFVIAVDIRTPVPERLEVQNGFDVISRLEMVESRTINDAEANEADLLLRPDVGSIFWGDFTNLEPAVAAGEAALLEKLPELRRLLADQE